MGRPWLGTPLSAYQQVSVFGGFNPDLEVTLWVGRGQSFLPALFPVNLVINFRTPGGQMLLDTLQVLVMPCSQGPGEPPCRYEPPPTSCTTAVCVTR